MKKCLSLLLCLTVFIIGCASTVFAIENPTEITNKYTDVQGDEWYCTAIKYATDKKLLFGIGPNVFSPSTPMTKAMFLTTLGRKEGINPNDYPGSSFADVGVESWYSPYVQWAYKQNLIQRESERAFCPTSDISRQEMAEVLFAYYKQSKNSEAQKDILTNYKDSIKISKNAENAMSWAVSEKILQGDDDSCLNPQKSLSRAEAAQVLYNTKDLVHKNNEDQEEQEIELPDEYLSITYTSKDPNSGSVATHSYVYDIPNNEILDIRFDLPFGSHAPICVYHKYNQKYYYVKNTESYRQIFEFDTETGMEKQLTEDLLHINHIIPYENKLYYVGVKKRERNPILACLDLETNETLIWHDDQDSSVWAITLDREKKKFYLSEHSEQEMQKQIEAQTSNDFEYPDHHIYEVSLDFSIEKKLYTATKGQIHGLHKDDTTIYALLTNGKGDQRKMSIIAFDKSSLAPIEVKDYKIAIDFEDIFFSKDGKGLFCESSIDDKSVIGYYDIARETFDVIFSAESQGQINSFQYVY